MGKNTNEMLHKWPRNWYKKRWWRIYFCTMFPTRRVLVHKCLLVYSVLVVIAMLGTLVMGLYDESALPFIVFFFPFLLAINMIESYMKVQEEKEKADQERDRALEKVEEMKKVKVDDPYEELYLQIIEPMRGVHDWRAILMPYHAAVEERLLPRWKCPMFRKKTGLDITSSCYNQWIKKGAYTPEELEPYAQKFVSLKAKIANSK